MKAILITGASTGLGQKAAYTLADLGFLVFAAVRSEADLAQFNTHYNISPIILDITQDDQRIAAFDLIASRVGNDGLYGLFNNAGVAFGGPLEALSLDVWREQFEVNVIGQVAMTKTFLPLLRQAHGARILFTGSQSGYFTKPFIAPYSASKRAVEAIVDSLRFELKEMEVSVHLLQPGVLKTPIWKKSLLKGEALEKEMDQNALSLYTDDLKLLKSAVSLNSEQGASLDEAMKAIKEAFYSDNPKIRFRVGKDARFNFLLSLLPDRLRETLIWCKIKRAKKKILAKN